MDDETVEEVPAKKEKPVFPGFNTTFKGYSQLPNEWLDEICSQIDNVAELKIVLYIYRHTWGFQEKKISPDEPAKHDETKQITTDEFAHGRKRKDGTRMDNGTGLGLTAVKDGVARAIKHGYIVCETDDRDRARIKKSYGLKMQNSDGRIPTADSHNPTSKNRNPTSDETGSDHRTEKDTGAANQLKESRKEGHPSTLSQYSLEKVAQIARDCKDEDIAQHQKAAQYIYQQNEDISEDDFYGLLFHTEDSIKRHGPRDMQEFFWRLKDFLNQARLR